MSQVPNRNDWVFGNVKNPLEDKEYMLRQAITQMLTFSTKIFKYNNLPDTIKAKDLETQLQVGGFAIWAKAKDKLYTFRGGLGGVPSPYYLPTIAVVANPALNFNESLKIDEDCVVMLNDDFYQGLMPLNNKYGSLLVEAEVSLRYAIINARVPALVQADNDSAYQSAVVFFDKIEKGNGYGVISSKDFFEGIKSHDFYKEAHIKDLIESIQYIKGSWFNAIGLNAAFNMKREAINEAEATLNEDILYPTVDNMLECRKLALERINKMFGTNITVELNSVWKQNRKHEELVLEMSEAEIEEIKSNSEVETKTEEVTENENA